MNILHKKQLAEIGSGILVLLLCAGIVIYHHRQTGVQSMNTKDTQQVSTVSKNLDGDYVLATHSPYSDSDITIASSTEASILYAISTANLGHTGELSGTAFRDTSTTSLTYLSNDYHDKEEKEGCMVSVTFLDDTHVTYSAIDKPIQSDGEGCSGYHGAHGTFFDGEVHVKDGENTLPTLVDLGFTALDETIFQKLVSEDAVSVENYIGTSYQDENEKEVSAERKLSDKQHPNALVYAIQSTNTYSGDITCDFTGGGGSCSYGVFMKDGANYYVMAGDSNMDEKTNKVFTYTTTDTSMAKKLPESFKKELERLGLDEVNVKFILKNENKVREEPSLPPVDSSFKTDQSMCKVFETDESDCQSKNDNEITSSSKIKVTLTEPFPGLPCLQLWKVMTATRNGELLWKLRADKTGYESFDVLDSCSPDGKYAVVYQSYNIGFPNQRQVGGGGTILNLETGEFTKFESKSESADDGNFLGFEKGKAHTGLVVCASPGYSSEVLPNGEVHEKIMIRKITSDKAIEIVGNLPEVKAWKAMIKKSNTEHADKKSEARVVADKETNKAYVIHVYESFSDHTASFGWYTVEKTTGKVTNEFD